MYQVIHGDDVYVCQSVEAEVDVEWLGRQGELRCTAIAAGHHIRMEGIAAINGDLVSLNDASHDFFTLQDITITLAKEAE